MAKQSVFIPFHLVLGVRDGNVLLACGGPQAAAYVTWNTAAVTCPSCLFMYDTEAEHGVPTALQQLFCS